jgi:hypothetical protein
MSATTNPPTGSTGTVEGRLNELLKQALLGRDGRTANVVRMLKTKVMERRTSAGFKGTVDDALHIEVIAAYQKQLRRALEEFQTTGDKGEEAREELRFEIEFCAQLLPTKLTQEELRAAVVAAIAALQVTDVKQVGKVVGEVMKRHRGKVEPGEVQKAATEELSKAP